MIVYLANKSQFREDILSNRIEEIVHESFQRQMDSVLGNDGIHDDCARRQRLIF